VGAILHFDKDALTISARRVEQGPNCLNRPTIPANDPPQILGIYTNPKKGTALVGSFFHIHFLGMSHQSAENKFEEISHGVPAFNRRG
jgi:hypothetical protein